MKVHSVAASRIVIRNMEWIKRKRIYYICINGSISQFDGEYEYIDAMIDEERLIIDIDFRSEFQIARSTKSYKVVLQTLPQIFVGKLDRLQKIINIISDASKQSLKKIQMPLPSWRRADYVKAKCLSPCTHIANTTVKTDKSPADDHSFNEKTTKPNPISDPKDLILVDEFEAVGAAPEVEKSKEAMKQWDIIGVVYNKGSIMQKPMFQRYGNWTLSQSSSTGTLGTDEPKRKPKAKQNQARNGKDKVKGHPSEENTT
ncbi:hypothetical protein Tco_1269231 [Tanacetum coccineum]